MRWPIVLCAALAMLSAGATIYPIIRSFPLATSLATALLALCWGLKHTYTPPARIPGLRPADERGIRVGFSVKRLPSKIDHIVIGSGISGLCTAAMLARQGQSVVVLEQVHLTRTLLPLIQVCSTMW